MGSNMYEDQESDAPLVQRGCESRCENAEEDDRVVAHANSRVDHIIATAANRSVETPIPEGEKDVVLVQVDEDAHPERRPRPLPMSCRAPNPFIGESAMKGLEIARLLAQAKPAVYLRDLLAREDYCRVPQGLVQVKSELDEEQRYIDSLPEPVEPSRAIVRLLESGEKEILIRGLKLRFQHTSAHCLAAGAKTERRAELEAELEQIKQDIENLSRPYIFVEVAQ
mmetsp:Transcript_11770/g.26647  ORF Transcript_11770/g.26647 Transcript_11770/m.26647 type:complete len:225 (-) Transcript_11770:44-718(-)